MNKDEQITWICEQVRVACGNKCAEEVLTLTCSLESSVEEYFNNCDAGLSLPQIVQNYLADNPEMNELEYKDEGFPNHEAITRRGEMTRRAHAVKHEWIVDADLDVCLRPMLFDQEGNRQVRYRPDPGEYRPLAEAVEKLVALEAEQEAK